MGRRDIEVLKRMAEENARKRAKNKPSTELKDPPSEGKTVSIESQKEPAAEPNANPEDLVKKKAAAAAKVKAAALAKQKRMGEETEDEPSDDLVKKKAAAAAKAKAAALAKQKRMTEEGGESPSDDLAKKKAAAAAKAKAAALAKQKRMTEEGGENSADDLAKKKAAAAAKAKAAALAKQKHDSDGPADSDNEKAKAIAAAKAKAAAAAKAKQKGADTKAAAPAAEVSFPSPNQPILDAYKAIIESELGNDSLEDSYINKLSKDVPTLIVKRDSYLPLVTCLRNHPKLRFDYLSEIHGTDFLGHFEVYLYLQSLLFKRDVVVKVKIDRTHPEIESVTPLWPGANWAESEAYDLLGIRFIGHPDLKRILLGEEWQGYPLRKDYVQYDDVEV